MKAEIKLQNGEIFQFTVENSFDLSNICESLATNGAIAIDFGNGNAFCCKASDVLYIRTVKE